MTQIPVKAWTCSQHDYPEQCECCEKWDCEECERSEWVQTGTRDASPFEELLLASSSGQLFPSPLLAKSLLRDRETT